MKAYDRLVRKLLIQAREMGVYLILRIQQIKSKHVLVNNGETQEMAHTQMGGISFQVFTLKGGSGFATSEKIDEADALKMLRIAAEMAFQMEGEEASRNTEIFTLPSLQETWQPSSYPFDYYSIEEEAQQVLAVNQQFLGHYEGMAIETFYRHVLDHWRVVRSDGTDVTYQIPRVLISNVITAKGNRAATTRASLSGGDLSILIDPQNRKRFEKRTHRACKLAQELLTAPRLTKGGKYKIILDYALAKGLAHEAFGHAAEADGMQTSILADEAGCFQVGRKVADARVSIIDEPLQGDYAFQPFSPNGEKRKKVAIVKNGVLTEALADIFSARTAGVTSTGAERAESYRHVPLPRMSNIRIELDEYLPLDKPFEEIEPLEVYELLQKEGWIEPEEEVLYLVGYKGGQVKTSQGEFVFNCSGIYRLGKEVTLYQPEIFSGKILSVLESIRGAVGPLLLDAQGTCGKAGQTVPSSGGSHYFLLLEHHDQVMIGGQ